MKQNILLIMTDQLRYDALSVNGNRICKTPNMDKLAAGGINFSRAYTPCALCSPARASILTGRFPHRHGVISNTGQGHSYPELPETEITFSQILKKAGYRTGYVGKWHVGVGKGPNQWGFDDQETETMGEFNKRFGETFQYSDIVSGGLVHNKRFLLSATRSGHPENDDTGYCTKEGLLMLEKYSKSAKPFFMRIDYSNPHPTYVLPEPYASMYDPKQIELDDNVTQENFFRKPYIHCEQARRWGTDSLSVDDWKRVTAKYYGSVTQVDSGIGRVLERLTELGLHDHTSVILTTDHGDAVGGHRMYDKGYCAYEEQYHIPLIIKKPGMKGGGFSTEWVSLCDLMPTILELSGNTIPDSVEIDGTSLCAAIDGKNTLGRDSIFAEFLGMQYGLNSIRMVRDERYKLVLNVNDMPELYDCKADPSELHNIAAEPSAKPAYDSIYKKLLAWMKKTNDPLLTTEWSRTAFDPEYAPAPGPWFAPR